MELFEQANRVAACFQLAAEDLQSTPKQSSVGADGGEMATATLGEIQYPEIKPTREPENSMESSSTVVPLVTETKASEPVVADVPTPQIKGKVVPLVKRSSGSGMKENKVPAITVMQSTGRKASPAISEASNCNER